MQKIAQIPETGHHPAESAAPTSLGPPTNHKVSEQNIRVSFKNSKQVQTF